MDDVSVPKVEHKIMPVSDELCAKCYSNIGNLCVAYCIPHSEQERQERLKGPPLCNPRTGEQDRRQG